MLAKSSQKKSDQKQARVSLKYFISDCLYKLFFDSISSQTLSNLIFSKILINSGFGQRQSNELQNKDKTFTYLITAFPIFSLTQTFGIKCISTFLYDAFRKREQNSSLNNTIFDKISCSSRHKKQMKILQTISLIIF